MKRLKNGKKFFLVLGLVSLVSCRTSSPPAFEFCLGDGVGGCDGIGLDEKAFYRKPSELKNAWIIPRQEDAKNFVSWCYDTDVSSSMTSQKASIKALTKAQAKMPRDQ